MVGACDGDLTQKSSGWAHYEALGRPKLICAPMVDGSELPFRVLVGRYGAQLCYSPMINSTLYVRDEKYRRDVFSSSREDEPPLAAQIAGHDPQTMLECGRLLQTHCDAVDINLGCPQGIARRGRYGAFLQDEWELLEEIVSTLHEGLDVPVWCKIRVFPDVDKSVRYAQMLERAGCQLLAVHGRTREQKGRGAPPASWAHIRAIVQAVNIPVFANGNVLSYEDAQSCMRETGAVGVLSAYALLDNPTLFANSQQLPDRMSIAREYLALARQFRVAPRMVRLHLFKFLRQRLNAYMELNEHVAGAKTLDEFESVLDRLAALTDTDGLSFEEHMLDSEYAAAVEARKSAYEARKEELTRRPAETDEAELEFQLAF